VCDITWIQSGSSS